MDKNKVIEAAAKHVAKGAYDKAIKEYQKVLEADPKDARILQKMGELYQKKNDNAQAANFFVKVAERYSADGFFLKAVAQYKQVLKLNPALVDINLKLAELHQQLQLTGEAMAHYQAVVTHYENAGNTKASLETLKKMVDLDPDNIPSRIKLGELFAKEKMNAEAIAELRHAGDALKKAGRTDEYFRVAERISSIEPENTQLARELAEAYLSKHDHKRALAKLQICFKADPRDVATLKLLGTTFEGLGQTSKTISVHKELAKVYQEQGRRDEVDRLWAQIERLDPKDPDLLARKGPAQRTASPPPAAYAAQAPVPPRAYAPPPPPSAPPPAATAPPKAAANPLGKLLTETDVYVKYGLHDKALEHLRKVFAIDPENLDAHEKAHQIYVASGNQAQAGEQLLNVLRLCARQKASDRALPYLATLRKQNPNHPELPTFVAILEGGGGHTQAEDEEAILVDSGDEEIVVSDAPDDALPDMALESAALEEAEEIAESQEYEIDSDEDEPLVAAPDDEEIIDDGEELSADEVISVPEEVPEYDVGADDGPTNLNEIGAKLAESAEETNPGLDTGPLRAAMGASPEAIEEEPVAQEEYVEQAEEAAAVEETPVEAPPDEEPAGEECDEASFFLDQGLYEEAREILETIVIAYPGHARATELLARLEALESGGAAASDEAPAEAAPEGTSDAFDLAAELAGELDEEAPAEALAATGEDDFQYSVEEVFSEFKKGLEKVVKPEDVDTHYDLGIAYKEMGLVDDAIGEFEVARQGCVGQKKEVDCLTMKGLLQMSKEEPATAVATFKQALKSAHATGETEKGLRFELALAYEAAGNAGRALFQFQAVSKMDPRYRDVASMVERLAAVTKPEADDEGASRTRRAG